VTVGALFGSILLYICRHLINSHEDGLRASSNLYDLQKKVPSGVKSYLLRAILYLRMGQQLTISWLSSQSDWLWGHICPWLYWICKQCNSIPYPSGWGIRGDQLTILYLAASWSSAHEGVGRAGGDLLSWQLWQHSSVDHRIGFNLIKIQLCNQAAASLSPCVLYLFGGFFVKIKVNSIKKMMLCWLLGWF